MFSVFASISRWRCGWDFSPCLKNGVAGLYDSVSKKIFFSKAGMLHAGPQTGIPAKFVEYVESDGTPVVKFDGGVLSGSGTVANGAVAVAGTISVKVGEPLTFSAAPLTLTGARVVIADLENMPASGREPVVVAVSDKPMTGHVRSAVPEWAARMSQRADGSYALELVRSSFSIRIR